MPRPPSPQVFLRQVTDVIFPVCPGSAREPPHGRTSQNSSLRWHPGGTSTGSFRCGRVTPPACSDLKTDQLNKWLVFCLLMVTYIYEEAAVTVLVFKRKIELNPLLLSFTVGVVTA